MDLFAIEWTEAWQRSREVVIARRQESETIGSGFRGYGFSLLLRGDVRHADAHARQNSATWILDGATNRTCGLPEAENRREREQCQTDQRKIAAFHPTLLVDTFSEFANCLLTYIVGHRGQLSI